MAPDSRVVAQCPDRTEALGQGHLVVQAMQSLVAQTAKIYAGRQVRTCHVLAKVRPSMHFARDQVMEGELGVPTAEKAPPGF